MKTFVLLLLLFVSTCSAQCTNKVTPVPVAVLRMRFNQSNSVETGQPYRVVTTPGAAFPVWQFGTTNYGRSYVEFNSGGFNFYNYTGIAPKANTTGASIVVDVEIPSHPAVLTSEYHIVTTNHRFSVYYSFGQFYCGNAVTSTTPSGIVYIGKRTMFLCRFDYVAQPNRVRMYADGSASSIATSPLDLPDTGVPLNITIGAKRTNYFFDQPGEAVEASDSPPIRIYEVLIYDLVVSPVQFLAIYQNRNDTNPLCRGAASNITDAPLPPCVTQSPLPCFNGGGPSCQLKETQAVCSQCPPEFTRANCSLKINDCLPTNPCFNGGLCTDLNRTTTGVPAFTCACLTGFTGGLCQNNTNDCLPNPCKNGGSCIDAINNYTCSCPIGFTDRNCTTNINDCSPSSCNGHGTCVDGINSFNCSCDPGYNGTLCQNNINDCAGQPCKNGGICTDGIQSYNCSCGGTGFSGFNCTIPIDDCIGHACVNGGVCVDGFKSYTCTCPLGFSGSLCQTNINDCSPNPCIHGTCIDGNHTYTCNCTGSGYSGTNCTINIDDCIGNLCLHGSSCIDGVNSYTCNCTTTGWSGNRCQTDVNDCLPTNPCQHSGVCMDSGANAFNCTCPPGYNGTLCENNINECLPVNPCLHGGTCVDGVNAFTCIDCNAGFYGVICNATVDPCVSHLCQNSGVCVPSVLNYTCDCSGTLGFTGSFCSIPPPTTTTTTTVASTTPTTTTTPAPTTVTTTTTLAPTTVEETTTTLPPLVLNITEEVEYETFEKFGILRGDAAVAAWSVVSIFTGSWVAWIIYVLAAYKCCRSVYKDALDCKQLFRKMFCLDKCSKKNDFDAVSTVETK